ncbi:alpha-amylase [Saccharobesus litoralis]|uniref:Alpha-amylase n=1 Tax=Saccharobesus litoralis TaxID=2172099 RepID=A0A2S0VXM9_9ALTE|nr:alpha-amylase [Saccharobesus litoralis]
MNRIALASSLAMALGIAGCSSQVDQAKTTTVKKDIYADYLNRDVRDDVFYFVMPDRFHNGDPSNDMGNPDIPESYGGFDPSKKSHFHGGDMKGLQDKLDYLEDMGVTAIWMTPILRNQAVQGNITGYHGYWVLDFTEIDPHLGSNQDLKNLINAAHARGMKVYFDIITNHTADVIKYTECHGEKGEKWSLDSGSCPFRSKEEIKTNPYTIVIPEGSENIKVPEWLNDPIYYHNQGDSFWQGESSVYGDFAGLDDVNTDDPRVVKGMIEIFKDIVDDFKPDGFRVDTVKHVNTEFWAEFTPAIMKHAQDAGIPNFHIFGEVYDGNPKILSHYTSDGNMPAILDFGFQGAAYDLFVNESGTHKLKELIDQDDVYNDGDSNVHLNPTFIGNHDMGRFAHFLDKVKTPLTEAQKIDKIVVAHALMYFSRGIPVIYYGDEQGFAGKGNDMAARQDMMPSKVAEFASEDLVGTDKTPADDNFDKDHPLYQAFAELGSIYKAHSALRRGEHHTRYVTTDGPGIYAFSRVELDNPVEYLLVFNTSLADKSVSLQATANGYSDVLSGQAVATSGGKVNVSVAPLTYKILKANSAIKPSKLGKLSLIGEPVKEGTDVELKYALSNIEQNPVPVFELTTLIDTGSGFKKVSFDNTLPLTAQFDISGLAKGSVVKVKTSATNFNGEVVEAMHSFSFD